MINRRALTWFLFFTFITAWILFLIPLAFGPIESPVRQTASMISWSLAMWAPGLAAILVTRYVLKKPISSLNLRRLGDKRAYLWAWILPPVLTVLAGLLTWAFGLGHLDLSFPMITQAIPQSASTETIPIALLVAIQAVFALTLAPIINTIFAIGEELGWRGFLLPQLLPLGQMKAILLSGLIWGIWHAPAILQGHNYPETPILGVLLMCGFTVLVGVIFSWLYLRTLSPWAPALAHGALNATAGLPLLFLTSVNITFGGTLTSLVGWIPLAGFVCWLLWSHRRLFRPLDDPIYQT